MHHNTGSFEFLNSCVSMSNYYTYIYPNCQLKTQLDHIDLDITSRLPLLKIPLQEGGFLQTR